MLRVKRAVPVILAIVVTWSFTTATSADSSIPNGVFVRNSEGLVWLVLDGQRIKIPVRPASDDEIAAVPVADQWAVQNDAGTIVAGDRPAWLADAPPPPPPPALLNPSAAAAPATATPTPVPAPAASGNSLTYQGLTVTVLKIERGWKSPNQFIKPHDGNEFITFDVRADNATADQIPLNPASFKVATEDGARWDRSSARPIATARVRDSRHAATRVGDVRGACRAPRDPISLGSPVQSDSRAAQPDSRAARAGLDRMVQAALYKTARCRISGSCFEIPGTTGAVQ